MNVSMMKTDISFGQSCVIYLLVITAICKICGGTKAFKKNKFKVVQIDILDPHPKTILLLLIATMLDFRHIHFFLMCK